MGAAGDRKEDETLAPERPIASGEQTIVGDESSGGQAREPEELARGAVIGRYVVTATIGSGGMGVVYAAYDPELDRKVALKVLRPWRRSVDREQRARQRLVAEAKALARLAHPNVVAVHDVGTTGGQVFIAMEHVDGQTLEAWLESQPTWAEIVPLFVQAGRGLAAAHAAGLVHRDFKPANVMVSADGRVRVLDFGVAHPESVTDPETSIADGGADPGRAEAHDTAMPHGTPPYMAPELFSGRRGDAKADQYSFCVALFEAVYGDRPFRGRTVAELATAIVEGHIAEPTGAAAPTWLRDLIFRGLRADPAERWPSMDALVEELSRDRGAPRRALVFAAVFAVAGSAFVAALLQSDPTPDERCARQAAQLWSVWDEDARQTSRGAFSETDLRLAKTAWEHVDSILADYTSRGNALQLDTCSVERPDALRSRMYACLDARRHEIARFVRVLEQADATVVRAAQVAARRLPDLDECADEARLMAMVAPPEDPDAAQQVATLSQSLAEARALTNIARSDEALIELEDIVEQATAVGYAPFLADVLVVVSNAQRTGGRYDEARQALRDAYAAALSAGHMETASTAALLSITLEGRNLGHLESAKEWAYHAQALQAHPLVPASHEPWRYAAISIVQREAGRFEEALAGTLRALEQYQALQGPEASETAEQHANAGILLRQLGRLDEAREHHEEALAILEDLYGTDHPSAAQTRLNLSSALYHAGQLEDALTHASTALEQFIAAYGPDHPEVAIAYTNRGMILAELGDREAALRHHTRALQIREHALPAGHLHTAFSMTDVGESFVEVGRVDEGIAQIRRAVSLIERSEVGDHPGLAEALLALGRAQIASRAFADAVPTLERALAVRAKVATLPHERLETKAALAQAVWSAGDHERADDIASQALAESASADDHATRAARAELQAWLEQARP